jgi:hypothetical protein
MLPYFVCYPFQSSADLINSLPYSQRVPTLVLQDMQVPL